MRFFLPCKKLFMIFMLGELHKKSDEILHGWSMSLKIWPEKKWRKNRKSISFVLEMSHN
jgi:hypothetical protein